MKLEIISILIMCILTSYGHIVIKQGSSHISFSRNLTSLLKQLFRIDIITGAAAVFSAPLFYFYALKSLDLNTAYSFTALNQILIPGLSFIFLKERITLKKITAVVLIAGGILIWNL